MEARKLVQSGLGSYVISVPKSWLDRHKLGKGSLIYVDAQGENLLLLPSIKENHRGTERRTLHTHDSVGILTRKLIAAYIEGIPEVLILGPRSKEKDSAVNEQIHYLAGYEIVEKQQNRLLVQDMLKIEDVSLLETFRKMDVTMRAMFEGILGQMKTGITQPEHYVEDDKLVNKLQYTISRLCRAILKNELTQREFRDLYEILLLDQLSETVEELGDHLKYLANELAAVSVDEQRKALSVLRNLFARYNELMQAYYKRDRDAVYGYVDSKDAIYSDCMKLYDKRQKPETVLVARRLRTIVLTLTHIAKIARYH